MNYYIIMLTSVIFISSNVEARIENSHIKTTQVLKENGTQKAEVTEYHHIKFGDRFKSFGKNIKEKVEKVTKSEKAREIRRKIKKGVKKAGEEIKNFTK